MKKGQKHTKESIEKNRLSHLGKVGFWKGKKLSKKTRKKISEVQIGKIPWNKGLTGYKKGHRPYNTGCKMFHGKKHSQESKEKMSVARIGKFGGENHPNWQGGVTSVKDKARHTREMRLWRKYVLERDNFVCQKTLISGGKLEAHHINNFSDFPELRTALENGITLSEKSHKEFHRIYGNKNNTLQQINEFIYG